MNPTFRPLTLALLAAALAALGATAVIAQEDAVAARDVVARTPLDKMAVSRAVATLEEKELVERRALRGQDTPIGILRRVRTAKHVEGLLEIGPEAGGEREKALASDDHGSGPDLEAAKAAIKKANDTAHWSLFDERGTEREKGAQPVVIDLTGATAKPRAWVVWGGG